ncbi:MAG: GDSL-type esterase/lipase family protein [Pseudoxanthomonas sp.]
MDAKRFTVLLAVLAALPIPGCAIADRAGPAMRLAVIGDSDSQAYQGFTLQSGLRGGLDHHADTLQWTEVLQRLRGRQLDQGDWGRYGMPGPAARLVEWFGMPARSPAKRDFRYNFAVSGAHCRDLMGGERQVPRLVRLMDAMPARWRGGVAVIRIGINDFGQAESLSRLARDPGDPQSLRTIDACVAGIRHAVAYLRSRHPDVRIVLAGIVNNADDPENLGKWQSARMQANIAAALDRYDDALKAIAAKDAAVAFLDSRAWFDSHWGGRDREGRPAYRTVKVAGRFRVDNTQGDAPGNAVLADGHAGTAFNALWAQALVDVLNRQFKAGLPPLDETEILPLLEAGERRAAAAAAAQFPGRQADPAAMPGQHAAVRQLRQAHFSTKARSNT